MRVVRWVVMALGLSALLLATRIVVVHVVGVVAFFVTAFQATVNSLEHARGEVAADVPTIKPGLSRLRASQAYRDSLRVEPILGPSDAIHLDSVRGSDELTLR